MTDVDDLNTCEIVDSIQEAASGSVDKLDKPTQALVYQNYRATHRQLDRVFEDILDGIQFDTKGEVFNRFTEDVYENMMF